MEQHIGVTAAIGAEHLTDESLLDPSRDANAGPVYIAAEDRAGAVRPVTVTIAITLAGEVLLDELDTLKGGMAGVNARVQHRHHHASAGERRNVCADGANPPRISSGDVDLVRSGGFNQFDRHNWRDPPDLWIAGGVQKFSLTKRPDFNLGDCLRGDERLKTGRARPNCERLPSPHLVETTQNSVLLSHRCLLLCTPSQKARGPVYNNCSITFCAESHPYTHSWNLAQSATGRLKVL